MKKRILTVLLILACVFGGLIAARYEVLNVGQLEVNDFVAFEADTAHGSKINVATVQITNAEIKALRATPKDLVAAPGAGKFLEFVGATIILDYGSNVLTESADNLVIQYDGGQDATAAIESTGFIDNNADIVAVIVPATIAAIASASVANDALELFNTGDGEIAGNAGADTTLTVKISYIIHDLEL